MGERHLTVCLMPLSTIQWGRLPFIRVHVHIQFLGVGVATSSDGLSWERVNVANSGEKCDK